jgi:hypothetical protein
MQISKIILPVRPQPDTLVAIFLLRKFGKNKFENIDRAIIEVDPNIGNVGDAENLKNGNLLIDVGGGAYDHHGTKIATCASTLVAKDLNIAGDPAISKLLRYAERDDKFGLGTVSKDQIDRTFGLSGLVGSLNKQFPDNPQKVLDLILPIIEAHYAEEYIRIHELPAIYKKLLEEGKVIELNLKSKTPIRAVLIESDNISMPGYLRAQAGGKYDIVVQKRSSGHVNILSKVQKGVKINLERLVAVIRGAEFYMQKGEEINIKYADLVIPARMTEVPNWYYDPATNSIQNGGVHTDLTESTKIPWQNFPKILEIAFNE